MAKVRAVGVVRVSEQGDREDERFGSPDEQREGIERQCERDSMALVDVFSELDVSGGAPLTKRPGLLRAIEAVEHGEADVVIVAYFDRLVRSLKVQEEVVTRVEAAKGRVMAGDFGHVSYGTAAQWLSATMLGMMGEYYRRSTGERVMAAKRRAVEQKNRPPHRLMLGFERDPRTGEWSLDEDTAPLARRVFELRAEGVSISEIRIFLRAHGVERSEHGIRCILRSRLAIGEISYNGWKGTIPVRLVDDDLFERAQCARAKRGRKPRGSERLLAGAGVLRCGLCGRTMRASTTPYNKGRGIYHYYRCSSTRGDAEPCKRRVGIGADMIEGHIREEIERVSVGIRAKVTSGIDVSELWADHERDRAKLKRVMAGFAKAGLDDDPDAIEELAKLKAIAVASAARAREAEELERIRCAWFSVGTHWDDMCLDERRDYLRVFIGRISVGPGRGLGRVDLAPSALMCAAGVTAWPVAEDALADAA